MKIDGQILRRLEDLDERSLMAFVVDRSFVMGLSLRLLS